MPSHSQSVTEQWKTLGASFITLIIITQLSNWLLPLDHLLLLVASIGASIILVFVLPNSPVSQPYPLLLGNFISALIGVACAYLPLDLYLMSAICICLCLLAMFVLNCIHPPAGATAMMPVIVGPEAVGGFYFALFPVFINMAVLVIFGSLFNRLWLKREYPVTPIPEQDPVHKHKDKTPLARLGIVKDDLAGALNEYQAFLNITEKDLANVVGLAQQKAYHRRFGAIRCKDIMSKDVITVKYDTELEQAWALLRLHKVKLLPVIDENKRVIGIISLVDFLKRANLKSYEGFAEKLINFVKARSRNNSSPRCVGQLMATPAFTVDQDQLIASLVPLLSDKGLHHIPVVDNNQNLVGIVTQSDLIAALYSGLVSQQDTTAVPPPDLAKR